MTTLPPKIQSGGGITHQDESSVPGSGDLTDGVLTILPAEEEKSPEYIYMDGLHSVHVRFDDAVEIPEANTLIQRWELKTDPEHTPEEKQKEKERLTETAAAVIGKEETEHSLQRAYDLVLTDEKKEKETKVSPEPVKVELHFYEEAQMTETQKKELLPKRNQLVKDLRLDKLQVIRLISSEEEAEALAKPENYGKLPENWQIYKDERYGKILYESCEVSVEDDVAAFQADRLSPFVLISDEMMDDFSDFRTDFDFTEKVNHDLADEISLPEEDISDESKTEEESGEGILLAGSSEESNYEVSISYDSEANIPEGSELVVSEISERDSEYDSLSARAVNALEGDAENVLSVKLLDISVVNEGETIEPEAPVDVTLQVAPAADNQAIETQVVSVGASAEVMESVYSAGEPEESQAATYENSDQTLQTVYAIIERSLTKEFVSTDGNTYEVTVTYGSDAEIPVGTDLNVQEIPADSNEYEAYLNQTAETLSKDSGSVSYARFLDISIVKDGEEIRISAPVEVKIQLKDKTSAGQNEEMTVVHFAEEPEVIDAAKDYTTEGEVIRFEAEAFSVYGVVYTVDFHWGEYTYNLSGESDILLSELLRTIGTSITESMPEDSAKLLALSENMDRIGNVEFSNPYLLQPDPCDDGDWLLISLAPFDTDEELTITLKNGETITIDVTDAYIGAPGGSNYTNFASAMDLSTITIQDIRNWPDTEVTTNNLVYSDGKYYWKGSLTRNEVKSLGASLTVRYKGAAMTAEGQVCDLVISFTDIKLYADTRTTFQSPFTPNSGFSVAVAADKNNGLPGVSAYIKDSTPSGYRYGIEEKVTFDIFEAGTETPVPGTFAFTAYDLNQFRDGQSPKNIVQAASHNTFAEQIQIPDINSRNVYYIGGDANNVLKVVGNIIMPRRTAGGMSYMSGIAAQAESGFSFIGYNAGGTNWQTEYYVMPRAGINHPLTSYSGYGGSIETTTTGVIGSGTVLDGGKVDSPRTYVVPTGKNVTYKATPEAGYTLYKFYVDNQEVTPTDNGDGSYSYTFNSVSTTHKICVSWKPTNDPPQITVNLGHIGVKADGSLHDLQTEALAAGASAATTLPYNQTVKLGDASRPQPPQQLTKDDDEYHFTFFALGDPNTMTSATAYGASTNMWVRYSEFGQYEYSTDNVNWETYGYGASAAPTVYGVYTHAGDETTHHVYVTVTGEATGAIVDTSKKLTYKLEKHSVEWVYSNGTLTKGSDTVTPMEDIELAPGQSSLPIAISYTTVTGGSKANSNITAEYLVVTQQPYEDYTLTDIELEANQAVTHAPADAVAARSYTYYATGSADSGVSATSNGEGIDLAPTATPVDTEITFVNVRDTVQVKLQKTLDDPSLSSGEKKDFSFTLRIMEQHPHGEHFAMLGSYVIQNVGNGETKTEMHKLNDDGSVGDFVTGIEVPKGTDVLIIERLTGAENIYDTTVTAYADSDTSQANDLISVYREADREYVVRDAEEDLTVTYTNSRKSLKVTVRNEIIGETPDHEFPFRVTLTDKNGAPMANYVLYVETNGGDSEQSSGTTPQEVKTDASGVATFALKTEEQAELSIPYGYALKVESTEASALSIAHRVDGGAREAGKIYENSGVTADHTVTFVNDLTGQQIVVEARESAMAIAQSSDLITGSEGIYEPTTAEFQVNPAFAKKWMTDQSCEAPENFHYSHAAIYNGDSELDGAERITALRYTSRWQYKPYTENNSGVWTDMPDGAKLVLFYFPTNVSIPVQKTLGSDRGKDETLAALAGEHFTFTASVTPAAGSPADGAAFEDSSPVEISAATVINEGTANGNSWTYALDGKDGRGVGWKLIFLKAGTYTVTVQETAGSNAGVTYTDAVSTLTYRVVEEEGVLRVAESTAESTAASLPGQTTVPVNNLFFKESVGAGTPATITDAGASININMTHDTMTAVTTQFSFDFSRSFEISGRMRMPSEDSYAIAFQTNKIVHAINKEGNYGVDYTTWTNTNATNSGRYLQYGTPYNGTNYVTRSDMGKGFLFLMMNEPTGGYASYTMDKVGNTYYRTPYSASTGLANGSYELVKKNGIDSKNDYNYSISFNCVDHLNGVGTLTLNVMGKTITYNSFNAKTVFGDLWQDVFLTLGLNVDHTGSPTGSFSIANIRYTDGIANSSSANATFWADRDGDGNYETQVNQTDSPALKNEAILVRHDLTSANGSGYDHTFYIKTLVTQLKVLGGGNLYGYNAYSRDPSSSLREACKDVTNAAFNTYTLSDGMYVPVLQNSAHTYFEYFVTAPDSYNATVYESALFGEPPFPTVATATTGFRTEKDLTQALPSYENRVNFHKISYQDASGTISHPDSYALRSTSHTVLSSAARDGWFFRGWNSGSAIYQPGDVIENITSDITLTAEWLELPKLIPLTVRKVWGVSNDDSDLLAAQMNGKSVDFVIYGKEQDASVPLKAYTNASGTTEVNSLTAADATSATVWEKPVYVYDYVFDSNGSAVVFDSYDLTETPLTANDGRGLWAEAEVSFSEAKSGGGGTVTHEPGYYKMTADETSNHNRQWYLCFDWVGGINGTQTLIKTVTFRFHEKKTGADRVWREITFSYGSGTYFASTNDFSIPFTWDNDISYTSGFGDASEMEILVNGESDILTPSRGGAIRRDKALHSYRPNSTVKKTWRGAWTETLPATNVPASITVKNAFQAIELVPVWVRKNWEIVGGTQAQLDARKQSVSFTVSGVSKDDQNVEHLYPVSVFDENGAPVTAELTAADATDDANVWEKKFWLPSGAINNNQLISFMDGENCRFSLEETPLPSSDEGVWSAPVINTDGTKREVTTTSSQVSYDETIYPTNSDEDFYVMFTNRTGAPYSNVKYLTFEFEYKDTRTNTLRTAGFELVFNTPQNIQGVSWGSTQPGKARVVLTGFKLPSYVGIFGPKEPRKLTYVELKDVNNVLIDRIGPSDTLNFGIYRTYDPNNGATAVNVQNAENGTYTHYVVKGENGNPPALMSRITSETSTSTETVVFPLLSMTNTFRPSVSFTITKNWANATADAQLKSTFRLYRVPKGDGPAPDPNAPNAGLIGDTPAGWQETDPNAQVTMSKTDYFFTIDGIDGYFCNVVQSPHNGSVFWWRDEAKKGGDAGIVVKYHKFYDLDEYTEDPNSHQLTLKNGASFELGDVIRRSDGYYLSRVRSTNPNINQSDTFQQLTFDPSKASSQASGGVVINYVSQTQASGESALLESQGVTVNALGLYTIEKTASDTSLTGSRTIPGLNPDYYYYAVEEKVEEYKNGAWVSRNTDADIDVWYTPVYQYSQTGNTLTVTNTIHNYICKVVDSEGVEHPFEKLRDALTYIRANRTAVTQNDTATIEMLVDYTMPSGDALCKFDSSDTDHGIKESENITITTASSGKYTYGGSGRTQSGAPRATIIRGFDGSNMFDVNGYQSMLSFSNIIIDGNKDNHSGGKGSIVLLNGTGGGSNVPAVVIGTGATLQNAKSSGSTGGGAVYVTHGTVTVNAGGSIQSCEAENSDGGAIYAESTGAVINISGSLTENSAVDGGAIKTSEDVIINIYPGATLSGNTASSNGGAIYTSGSVYMTGGSIENNTAAKKGAGIYADNKGSISFSGAPVVYNNKVGGNQRNVEYSGNDNGYSNITINLTSQLGDSAKIGVYAPGDHNKAGEPFGTRNGITANLYKFINDQHPELYAVKVDGDDLLYWSYFIARVSNDNGATWTYHEYLISAETDTQNGQTILKGAFNQANSLTGDVVIETLRETAEISGQDRYTLTSGYEFNFDNAQKDAPTTLTLRTTPDTTWNPVSGEGENAKQFISTITRGFDGDSMITFDSTKSATNEMTVTNITLDGGRGKGETPVYSSAADGGIVFVKNGSLTIEDGTTLRNSVTTGNGGAVYVVSGKTLNMTGGSIDNCKAANGGGVYLKGGITGSDGEIKDCVATAHGGGVCTDEANAVLTLSGTNITNCLANQGGGVYIKNVNSTISAGTISGCKATLSGALGTGQSVIPGTEASAIQHGGGIYVEGLQPLTVGSSNSSVSIENCEAAVNGGGIYATREQTDVSWKLTLSGTVAIYNCKAGDQGGGIYTERFMQTIVNSADKHLVISNCEAGTNGGGICFNHSDKSFDLRFAQMNDCKAGQNGGALWIKCRGNTAGNYFGELRNVTIDGCVADVTQPNKSITNAKNGGGIYLAEGKLILNGTTIQNCSVALPNTAANEEEADGGALYACAGVEISMEGSGNTITGNSAAAGAGIYLVGGSTLKLSGSPNFGGTDQNDDGSLKGTEGNFAKSALTSAKNGDKPYTKARQDIYLTGTGSPLASLVLTGNLTNVAAGSIWVWANDASGDVNHYKMLKQFAVLDSTFSGTVSDETYKAFRNARTDAVTDCGGDYLTGQAGDDVTVTVGETMTTYKCVRWTGGFDFVFMKVNGDGEALDGATFTLYKANGTGDAILTDNAITYDDKRVAYQVTDSNGAKVDAKATSTSISSNNPVTIKIKTGTAEDPTVADRKVYGDGLVAFSKIPPGTYFLKETVRREEPDLVNGKKFVEVSGAPSVTDEKSYEPAKEMYKVVIDGKGWFKIYAAGEDASDNSSWTAENQKEVSTVKFAQGSGENAPYTLAGDTISGGAQTVDVYRIVNISPITPKVILRKVDSSDYTSLPGAKFTVYLLDKQTIAVSKTITEMTVDAENGDKSSNPTTVNSNEGKVTTVVTVSNGKKTTKVITEKLLENLPSGSGGVYFSGFLPAGIYYVKETQKPNDVIVKVDKADGTKETTKLKTYNVPNRFFAIKVDKNGDVTQLSNTGGTGQGITVSNRTDDTIS